MAAPVKVARQQTTSELSGTFRTPTHTRTLRNLPEPASGTYTSIRRNRPEPSGTYLRNLHQHTPEPSGTFRNPPPEPTQHTPELSGTFRNPPPEPTQHTPELSGTFRNLPPEPAPATCTDTHRSLSGLKTPLAYAVGEQLDNLILFLQERIEGSLRSLLGAGRAQRPGSFELDPIPLR